MRTPALQYSDERKKPDVDNDEEEDEAPVTPTDEPSPIPVRDPPVDDRPHPPLTVAAVR